MKKTKTQNGITLVALIITVVVLLLLAVVTIASVRDQGLFAKVQEAMGKHKEKETEQNTTINGYTDKINSYMPGNGGTTGGNTTGGNTTGGNTNVINPNDYIGTTWKLNDTVTFTSVPSFSCIAWGNMECYPDNISIDNGLIKYIDKYDFFDWDEKILYKDGAWVEQEFRIIFLSEEGGTDGWMPYSVEFIEWLKANATQV